MTLVTVPRMLPGCSCASARIGHSSASSIFSSIFVGPLRRPRWSRDKPLSPRFPYRIFIGRSGPGAAVTLNTPDRASRLLLSRRGDSARDRPIGRRKLRVFRVPSRPIFCFRCVQRSTLDITARSSGLRFSRGNRESGFAESPRNLSNWIPRIRSLSREATLIIRKRIWNIDRRFPRGLS